jgi:hypothetical protein
MNDAPTIIALRSAAPEATHVEQRHGVSGPRGALKVRFAEFMDPEYVEDCLDVMAAKESLAIANTDDRISWEQLKQQLRL